MVLPHIGGRSIFSKSNPFEIRKKEGKILEKN